MKLTINGVEIPCPGNRVDMRVDVDPAGETSPKCSIEFTGGTLHAENFSTSFPRWDSLVIVSLPISDRTIKLPPLQESILGAAAVAAAGRRG